MNLPTAKETEDLMAFLPQQQRCLSCAIDMRSNFQEFRSLDQGHSFVQHGIEYHCEDFVYILPRQNIGVLEIAQIQKIEGVPDDPLITVRCFGRDNDYDQEKRGRTGSSQLVSDEVCHFARLDG